MGTTQFPTNLGLGNTGQSQVLFITPARRPRRGSVIGWHVYSPTNPVNPPPNPGGIPFAPDNTPLGNPDWPCAGGPEILPSENTSVPVDQGTAYIFQHQIGQDGRGFSSIPTTPHACHAGTEFAPLTDVQQHFVAYDLYRNIEAITNRDQPVKVTLPIRSATIVSAVLQGGAATALDALEDPQDGKYIECDGALANRQVTVAFDPTELVNNWGRGRITKLSLRYISWRDADAEPAPGEGWAVSFVDTGIANEQIIGDWCVTDYQDTASYVTKEIGETNPIPRGKTAWPSRDLHPFVVGDLVNGAAATNQVFFKFTPITGSATQTLVNLDYVELVVELIPEYRHSAAIRMVSNIYGGASANGNYANDVEWRDPTNSQQLVPLPTDDGDMFMVVREARPPSASDYWRAKPAGTAFVISPIEAWGPSLKIMGALSTRSEWQFTDTDLHQLATFRSAVADDQVVPGTTITFYEYKLAVAHYRPDTVAASGSFWPSYRGMAGLTFQQVYGGAATAKIQRVWLRGGVSYSNIRVLVQPTSQANDLIQFQVYDNTLALVTATASYYPDDIRTAYPDQGNGWREAVLPLAAPVVPFADGWYYLQAISPVSQLQPWLVAAAEPMGLQPYFSYDVAPDGFGTGTARIIDYAMCLVCDPGVPAAPTANVVNVAALGDSCGVVAIPTVVLTWTSTGAYDQYVVEATAAFDGLIYPISKAIPALAAGQVHTFTVLDPPWDTSTTYSITGWNGWSLTPVLGTQSAPVLILSGQAQLGFSTIGLDTNISAIYVPATDGQVEIAWTDLTPVEIVQLHGSDYQDSLVPTEDRDFAFTVTLLIDHLAVCPVGTGDPLDIGQRAMSPTPWETLHAMIRAGFVEVQFPGGLVRSYIMTLGSMRSTTQFGVYAAEVTLTKYRGFPLGLYGSVTV